ncbi:hypothetical protein [Streptomyces atriruber]|uniref:hypothetical protein n=1 Tax=Streptomyces atriruber TaxID=545121 RepID=UPI0006E2652C|nr:hypothetical protein [Streptomyces atriruber]
MTILEEPPLAIASRDPRELLNAVHPHVKECTYNVFDAPGNEGDLWDREVALLMRDNMLTRQWAEEILGNAVMYLVTAMERPDLHIGVGEIVDLGVHQIILDSPVYFAFCHVYNSGAYKHHAPLVERRTDGLVLRTVDVIRGQGFEPSGGLWAVDGANCSPCDDKVPDSH